jgi:hypothetical protein
MEYEVLLKEFRTQVEVSDEGRWYAAKLIWEATRDDGPFRKSTREFADDAACGLSQSTISRWGRAYERFPFEVSPGDSDRPPFDNVVASIKKDTRKTLPAHREPRPAEMREALEHVAERTDRMVANTAKVVGANTADTIRLEIRSMSRLALNAWTAVEGSGPLGEPLAQLREEVRADIDRTKKLIQRIENKLKLVEEPKSDE